MVSEPAAMALAAVASFMVRPKVAVAAPGAATTPPMADCSHLMFCEVGAEELVRVMVKISVVVLVKTINISMS